LIRGKAGTRTPPAVAELVRIGPRALPALLSHLDDDTPTKLTIDGRNGLLLLMYQRELFGNPLNARERPFLSDAFASRGARGGNGSSYTVTVGDVCFAILGQVVGRSYQAVRYQPSGIVIVNSPVLDRGLSQALRAVWSGDDPERLLFDALLTDYSTEGVFNGESLDGWDVGSDLQVQAAVRLLFYFPAETALFIADRVRRLDVRLPYEPRKGIAITDEQFAAVLKREVANGVRTDAFLRAVCWCPDSRIREAVESVRRRTNDPDLKRAIGDHPPRSASDAVARPSTCGQGVDGALARTPGRPR
jgi:hypothetical protein